jgi:hypothetical protein
MVFKDDFFISTCLGKIIERSKAGELVNKRISASKISNREWKL